MMCSPFAVTNLLISVRLPASDARRSDRRALRAEAAVDALDRANREARRRAAAACCTVAELGRQRPGGDVADGAAPVAHGVVMRLGVRVEPAASPRLPGSRTCREAGRARARRACCRRWRSSSTGKSRAEALEEVLRRGVRLVAGEERTIAMRCGVIFSPARLRSRSMARRARLARRASRSARTQANENHSKVQAPYE